MKVLGGEFQKDYMINLKAFLASEIDQKKVVYPHGKDIFSAFSNLWNSISCILDKMFDH